MAENKKRVVLNGDECNNVVAVMDEDGILTITIDTKKEFGLSASEKNIIVASTKGNKAVDGTKGGKLGLNFYRPK